MATTIIEIPDFDFSSFYYPDFVRALTSLTRQNVPEITDERDEEPYTQLLRAFALVGHLNNVLLDVVATETLLPSARLLESVRSHLRLMDVILEQAKPSSADVIVELSKIFFTTTNFIPIGTQVATEETDESPQIVFEADGDNEIEPTDKYSAIFSFDPAFVQFLSNVFHAGDKITVATVDFTPSVEFAIGATLDKTIDNFILAFNSSTDVNIEDRLFAFKVDDTVFITVLNDDVVSIAVSVVDNELETILLDQTASGADAPISNGSDRRGDEFIPTFDRTLKNVTFSLKKVATPTGNVRCVIEEDASGDPSGVVIATSTNVIDISTITGSHASYQFDFDSSAALTAAQKYWFILEYDSPVNIAAPVAEVTEIEFTDGTIAAVAEVSDVKINNLPIFFDVIGKAKHWLLDSQAGSNYAIWYNVTDGVNPQTDGDTEITTIDFVGQTGVTHDVIGAANHIIFNSAGDATAYYAWLNVTDGANAQADPAPGGTGLQVDILAADTAPTIAVKVAAIITAQSDFVSTQAGNITTIINVAAGVTTDTLDGTPGTGAVIITTTQGAATPIVPGRTSVQVDILATDSFLQLIQKTAAEIDLLPEFSATDDTIQTVNITQLVAGVVTDPADVDAGVTVTIPTPGIGVTNDYDVAGNGLHWFLNAQSGTNYYVWYNVTDGDNAQSDPTVGGRTGIQVDIVKADTPANISTKTTATIDSLGDFGAISASETSTVTDANDGDVTDATDVDANVAIVVSFQGVDESRVVMDSSGLGDSRHFTSGAWGSVSTSLVMKLIADSTNFASRSGGFGADKSGEAVLTAVTFPMFTLPTVPGSIFYAMHESIMWDVIDFTLDTFGAGIQGVWEFYDGNTEDVNPDEVTNLGPNLELDLTSFLGDIDRTGTIVEVKYTETGAFETASTVFEGGVNKVRTIGLLGQVAVSIDRNQYLVGSNWNEVDDIIDVTNTFTEDGKVGYTLPQTRSQNWTTKRINAQEGFFLRFRVISIDELIIVDPIVNLVNIQEANHFLLFAATQGESKNEVPLASSNGQANQQYELTFTPLIVEALIIQVDEGTGFTQWSLKENFLTSTQISKDYTLEIDASDVATVTFGDGQNGKIPAAGVDNIRAFYRVGADVDGNVGSLTVTINKSGIAFVNRVFNPRAATGWQAKEGSTDEDLARLKIEGPATLRVRERALAPQDYEFLSTQFTSSTGSQTVSRALAIEETFGIKTIELVVVGIAGAVLTQAQLDELSDFFNGNKPLGIDGVGLTNHEAIPINYTPRIIPITANITGGLKEPIENALTALLNPDAKFADGVTHRWDFGDKVPTAIIIAEIIDVDPINIKNVDLVLPAADIQLATRELPLAGTLIITIL